MLWVVDFILAYALHWCRAVLPSCLVTMTSHMV